MVMASLLGQNATGYGPPVCGVPPTHAAIIHTIHTLLFTFFQGHYGRPARTVGTRINQRRLLLFPFFAIFLYAFCQSPSTVRHSIFFAFHC